MHHVSKIAWLCLQPSGLLLIMLLVGAAVMWTRYQRTARTLVALSAALVLVGGLLPLSAWLTLPLENRFARADLSGRDIDGVIVLGGMEDARVATGRHVHAFNESAERLTEAAALARAYPRAKIVFSGGASEILGAPTIGADAAALVLRDLIPDGSSRLLLERKARNTWENAVYTKALVKPKPGERWLLVTSAWHMPRAMAVFRKVGFEVEPWPVDYRTAGGSDVWRLFDAPAEGLKRLETVLHEWIGLVAYRVLGRSDELLPGPR